jgi:hypothetical protein
MARGTTTVFVPDDSCGSASESPAYNIPNIRAEKLNSCGAGSALARRLERNMRSKI